MPHERSAECRCNYRLTCEHCCRNVKPWFFTPDTKPNNLRRASCPKSPTAKKSAKHSVTS